MRQFKILFLSFLIFTGFNIANATREVPISRCAEFKKIILGSEFKCCHGYVPHPYNLNGRCFVKQRNACEILGIKGSTSGIGGYEECIKNKCPGAPAENFPPLKEVFGPDKTPWQKVPDCL